MNLGIESDGVWLRMVSELKLVNECYKIEHVIGVLIREDV